MVCGICNYIFERPKLGHDGRDICPECYTPLDEIQEAEVYEEPDADYPSAWEIAMLDYHGYGNE